MQFTGIIGAPDMSEEAVDFYQDALEETLQSEAWASYAESEGLVTDFRDSEAFGTYLAERTEVLGGLLDGLGLRKDK